ncbi:insulinase family protein, partial [bacterium]|nr:insulinase family protein [bacterium]
MQDSGYHSCALSNGLKLHVLERRELPIVVLMVLYSVGSSHETPAQYGMAHFLEHMMFKGSEQFPLGSIDLFSHRSGGENNAFTSRDFTVYYHVLPARHWKSALEIEIDRMCSLQLEEAEYESEKRVVLEELSMYEDDPQEALYDFHYSKAFSKAHPYHHPIIGTRDVLLAQDLKMMEEFYRSNYRVDNASLLLLGDLNASLATRAIQKMFEG